MNAEQLRNIPLFAGLQRTELEELTSLLKERTYPAHHTVFWMNEKGEQLYIIIKGTIEISYTDDEGKEVLLAQLEPGSFFGELSLIDGEPHSATARTRGQAVLLTLDRESFHHYINKHPQLCFTLLQVLSARLRESTVKVPRVLNINQELDAKRTPLQQSIDNIARALTNGYFLGFYILFIVGWIVSQIILFKRQTAATVSFIDRPPAFSILDFFLTLTSFLLTILILNSQRRQAESDRIRGEIEYQVNVKSQAEVMKLQLKMDKLIERLKHSSRKEESE